MQIKRQQQRAALYASGVRKPTNTRPAVNNALAGLLATFKPQRGG